jgi:Fur family ferric uptake transcriptional regulator
MASRANLVELRAAVRSKGLRATPSRLAVLELLRACDAPIDLSEVGLVRRTDVGDHVWRFEAMREDHDATHPHFVCTECGTVECLPEIELAVRRRKAPRAVRQRQVEVQVRGRCDACG